MRPAQVFHPDVHKLLQQEIEDKSAELIAVKASEFIAKMKEGGEIEGYVVDEEIDICHQDFAQSIFIYNCVFHSWKAIGAEFTDNFVVRESAFKKQTLFGKQRQAYLEKPEAGAVIRSLAHFSRCIFMDAVSFQGCSCKTLKLEEAKFASELLLSGCKILQTLSISKTEHGALVHMVNSSIKTLNLQSVISDGPWRFDRSHFKDAINILNDVHIFDNFSCFRVKTGKFRVQDTLRLSRDMNFSHMRIGESLVLKNLHVEGRADMNHLHLEKYVPKTPKMTKPNLIEITGCEFRNGLNLNGMEGEGQITLFRSRFYNFFAFENCLLHQAAHFTNNIFNCPVSFAGSKFVSHVDFTSSIFHYITDFREVNFLGKAIFYKSIFGSMVDFSEVRFCDDINFLKTEAEKAKIKKEQVKDYIVFKSEWEQDSIGKKLHKYLLLGFLEDAHNTARGYEDNAQEYSFLKSLFERQNDFDAADWAYYMLKRSKRMAYLFSSYKKPKNFVRYLVNLFLEYICGYGTRPFRAMGSSMLLILVFACCYWLNLDAFHYDQRVLHPVFDDHKFINELVVALYLSIVAFTYGLGDVQATGVTAIILMLESLMGLLLVGLFIVSFSRKVIR